MPKKQWAGTKRCDLLKDIRAEVKEIDALSAKEKESIVKSLDKLIKLLCP